MRNYSRLSILLACLALSSCWWESRFTEVSDPFYLGYIEDPDKVALFRCIDGGCAGDELPGPKLIAAGADARYVVLAQQPIEGAGNETFYYYFKRIPQEKSGWGSNPEEIVGPMGRAEFDAATQRLSLPPLTIKP